MSQKVHVFDYLSASLSPPPAVCVLYGDEPFLRHLALKQLRAAITEQEQSGGEQVQEACFSSTDEWRDISDELSSLSLFGGGRRLVVVEDADDFVSKHRRQLEDYVAKPRKTGVLVLQLSKFPGNTKLFKAVDKAGLPIECRPPERKGGKSIDEAKIRDWLVQSAAERHQAKLKPAAASLLLDLRGVEFGMLDQELAKLSLFAGVGGEITTEMVQDVVGGWKGKTIWELVDSACEGDAAEALRQLDRLLQSGESPLAPYGQLAWSLRRFAAAVHLYEDDERTRGKGSLRAALQKAGFREWTLDKTLLQLRQLGRQRAGQLYPWLLELDLALKGTHSGPDRARFALEQLFLRLAGHSNAKASR